MTREEHIYQLKQYLQGKSISMCPSSSLYWQEHWEEVIKALEQEPILDKIFCIIHPLSIMSTPELEHKAIMQIAEMLEPLCLSESERTNES